MMESLRGRQCLRTVPCLRGLRSPDSTGSHPNTEVKRASLQTEVRSEDVKGVDFMEVFSQSNPRGCDDSFAELLTYLQNRYPRYDKALEDPAHKCWGEDEELYLLSTLVLLHASIYHPSKQFQENAAKKLNGDDQILIVNFLEKSMSHERNLNRDLLLECIPSSSTSSAESSQQSHQLKNVSPTSPLPNSKRRSHGTPLAEFLSSPIARQRRQSGNLRERLSLLENYLEQEQAEKVELQEKISQQATQIADLAKKYKEKAHEVDILREDVRKAEEGQEVLSEEKGDQQMERLKLRHELASSEEYIKKLEDELIAVKSSQDSLNRGLSAYESRTVELEGVLQLNKDECRQLKEQLERLTEENVHLSATCSQLERDLNQVQTSTLLSPRKSIFNSPNRTLSPTPESLGFIVEREMIVKENENIELQNTLKELDSELRKLRCAYKELEEKALMDSESALRSQKKFEAKLLSMQSTIDSTGEELKLSKKAKDDLRTKLSDVTREKEELDKRLEEEKSLKSAMSAERKTLTDTNHSLEVKIAKLEAKLVISSERETELHEILKRKSDEVENVQQNRDRMEVDLKKSSKERDMLAQQLEDTLRKLSHARNVFQEKNDLEEQVLNLKQLNEELEKNRESVSAACVKLENELLALTGEKKIVESQLRDATLKKNELALSLQEVTLLKDAVVAEKLALLKGEACWEEKVREASQRLEEAKEQIAKEETEKRAIQNELAEALAENERLTTNLSISNQQENDLTSNLTELSKQKKVIENQLSAVIKEREKLKDSLQDSVLQFEKVTQDSESLKLKLTEKVLTGESKISELLNEKAVLENVISEERTQNCTLQNQVVELKQNFNLAQLEISKVKGDLEALQNQCEEKTSLIANLEAEKNDIEDDVCQMGRKLNDKIQECLSLKKELCLLKEESEKHGEECESIVKRNAELESALVLVESKLATSSEEQESLLAQLKSVTENKNELVLQKKYLEGSMTDLETKLSNLHSTNADQLQQILVLSAQIEDLMQVQERMKEDFSVRNRDLQDDCDEKSQQLNMLRDDLAEIQRIADSLAKEKAILRDQVEVLRSKNDSLEEVVATYISDIETRDENNKNILEQLTKAQLERDNALNTVVAMESARRALSDEIETERTLKATLDADLQTKERLLIELRESCTAKEELLSEYSKKSSSLAEEKTKLQKELQIALEDRGNVSLNLERVTAKKLEAEKEFNSVKSELLDKVKSLQEKLEESCLSEKVLEREVADHLLTIEKVNQRLQSMEVDVANSAQTIVELKEKLKNDNSDVEKKLKSITEINDSKLKKFEENEEVLRQVQLLNQKQKEMLMEAEKEKEVFLSQIGELQGSIDVKEELLSDTQKCLEKLRGERDSLRELLTVKDQIITCHKATASSLERQSNDELEVAMKLLEGEVHSSQSTSEMMAQELRNVQKNFEEEKMKLQTALEEAQSTAKSYQQEAVELKQQLTEPRGLGKIAELQQEEKIWKLDRVKNQLEFQFDSMMGQKVDVEEHLNQLRDIIKDVTRICDTLFVALPNNCDAVHEVTVMKKEVESKLRAVDQKYADSLCSIICLAHELFIFQRKQTEETVGKTVTTSEELLSEERENIEVRVSKSCEAMTSLVCDVRSVINSCKFLIERCESYLKAQTRESLKIKIVKEEANDLQLEISNQTSVSSDSKLLQSSGNTDERNVANFTDDFKNCTQDKSDWFGGSTTLEEGYHLMKKSHADLELKVADLEKQLEELQTSVPEQIHNEMGSKIAKLQDRINTLMLRPTQEMLDEKLKELHNQYSNKLEGMKIKMKQIVKDEVDKVEEEKARSEEEIVAKYSKRITEYEDHVHQLSAQLWKLGEKLLQEQQDHKNAKGQLVALKERQRQYLMSKQRTQSLDRLDLLIQAANKSEHVPQMKRRCNSQVAQSGLASAKVHPMHDDTSDVMDEGSSRRSTMMAPASMGLAFPEEDEDGEVFNNDYLAELKEGKCRVATDGRLSELQFRNSLCPPHLKSSYPLETQFHDSHSLKDEEIKGPDRRLSRQGKDRGTTTYKKPGPPTPSKKAGRLSLQGKEDVTPRVAALREHNESQTSQGTGMLRAGKTTPSRLRALFTSSKVANASLPASKRDESSTPATPTSKRLSIFRRRFGSNKENNQSAASGYSSFH